MNRYYSSIFEKPPLPDGARSYTYSQIMHWVLKKKVFDFSMMTNLSPALRIQLSHLFTINTLNLIERKDSSDGTVKFLFELKNSKTPMYIESVYITSHTHTTACLSTQTGCVCGCIFCATGALGNGHNLHFSEIVLQLLNMENILSTRISHIVFMGMGEPLHNYEEVVKAIRFFEQSLLRISARKITLSTIGIPDKIRRLTDENVRVELAISLHSAIENKRRSIIRYKGLKPIDELMDACDYYFLRTKRLPTIEYVLVNGLNDGKEDIHALVQLLRKRPYKVNLIPLNKTFENYKSPSREIVQRFCESLQQQGIKTTIRRSTGQDIDAACGQLCARHERIFVEKC